MCWDLLSEGRPTFEDPVDLAAEPATDHIEFQVENFFGVGSPLGLYKFISGESLVKNPINASAYYNIFHPSDPIAYRVEPLLDSNAVHLQPVKVPYTKGGLKNQIQGLTELGNKISEQATQFWGSLASLYVSPGSRTSEIASRAKNEEKSSASSKDDGKHHVVLSPSEEKQVTVALRKLNPSGRLDYSVQEGVLYISVIAALASHMSYFEDPDLANFVLDTLYSRPSYEVETRVDYKAIDDYRHWEHDSD
jgi:hypothetical protein